MTLAVHLAPLPDELLSSWVHRTCHANATSLYSLLWHHGLKCYAQVDLDQCKNRKLLLWLARELKHPEGICGVRDMSLLPVLEMEKGFPHRSWIRGIDRRAFKWRSFRYCPVCLSEDEQPCFRRYWRLDWYEICHHHQVQMFNACTSCEAPLILHRVRWHKSHLARCYSCDADLRYAPNRVVALDQSSMKAIDDLFFLMDHRDKRKYAAIHFLEAFLDQWRRVQGVDEPVEALETIGVHIDVGFAYSSPAMFLATAAHELWQLDKKLLGKFISNHRRWFNLAVRDFQCPAVMHPYYKSLKWSYDLNAEIINQAANEISKTGREPTPARIARKIGCHVSRVENFLNG